MADSTVQSQQAAETFRQAADANCSTPTRRGNVIELSSETVDDCLITADLHGNQENFQRICELADLPSHPRRHLVLQEVCHGGPVYEKSQGCMSHRLLEAVARLKCEFPEQVHFLLSNHELSELTDHPICKGSKMLNLMFRLGMQEAFGEQADQVREAMREFIGTCPLAVRMDSGVLVTHSIPEEVDRRGYDADVFQRKLTQRDLNEGGAAFRLVWGRDFREPNARAFAKHLGARVLVNGHEPAPQGYLIPNDLQVILDCCGPSACYLLLPTGTALDHSETAKQIRRLSDASAAT